MDNRKPLEGIRVIELATFLAAPSCTKTLADLGAEVIKVEQGNGDTFRSFGPVFKMKAAPDHNPAFDLMNGGKKSTVINMKSQGGLEAFYALIASADILVTSVREDALKRLHCDYDTLSVKFPRLIMARISAFGDKGERAAEAGYDAAAFWAASGFLLCQRQMVEGDKNYPVASPQGMGDVFTGAMLGNGILSALYAREKTGKGDYITASIYGTALWGLGVMLLSDEEHHQYGWPKYRDQPGTTPYKCSDGKWVCYVSPVHDRYWPGICRAFKCEDLDCPDYYPVWEANKRKPIYVARFEEAASKMTAQELRERLVAEDVPCTILGTYREVNHDPQAIANGFIQEHHFPDGESCMMTLPSVRSRNAGDPKTSWGPLLAHDTVDVLKQAGFSEKKIEELISNGDVVAK